MPMPVENMSLSNLAQSDQTPVPTWPSPTATTWPSPTATASPTVTQTVFQYFPLIENALTPALGLVDFYSHDETGTRRAAFQPSEPHTYLVEGVNNRTTPLTATLRFVQTSACGDSVLYSDTLSLPPGAWQQAVSSPGLACTWDLHDDGRSHLQELNAFDHHAARSKPAWHGAGQWFSGV